MRPARSLNNRRRFSADSPVDEDPLAALGAAAEDADDDAMRL